MSNGISRPPEIQPKTIRRKRNAIRLIWSFFQRNNMPKPTAIASGAINGINTALKYGGPTEILPKPNASITRGYRVPSKILEAVTTSRTLFSNIADSLETSSKRALLLT